MKILDAGDHHLSNAEVLSWIQRKRAQHEQEDAEDAGHGLLPAGRPKNFITALVRHERELSSAKYPYAANPSIYAGENCVQGLRDFAVAVENAVQDHLEEEWRERLNQKSKNQIDREYARLQDMKCLTKTELLMIFNHAPTCVEMLQPMVDNVDVRFSAAEQQLIVDAIIKYLHRDEEQTHNQAVVGEPSEMQVDSSH